MEPPILSSGSERATLTIPGLNRVISIATYVTVAVVAALALRGAVGTRSLDAGPSATAAGPRSATTGAAIESPSLGAGPILVVGRDIRPGIYANLSDGECHWTRFKRVTGTAYDIALTERFQGLRMIEVQATDAAFAAPGCQLRRIGPARPSGTTVATESYPP